MSKIIFDLSPYTHQRFKVKCIEAGVSMRSVLEHLVEFYIGEAELYSHVDQDGTLERKLNDADNVESFKQRKDSTEYLVNTTDGDGYLIDYGAILFFKGSKLTAVANETFLQRKARLGTKND